MDTSNTSTSSGEDFGQGGGRRQGDKDLLPGAGSVETGDQQKIPANASADDVRDQLPPHNDQVRSSANSKAEEEASGDDQKTPATEHDRDETSRRDEREPRRSDDSSGEDEASGGGQKKPATEHDGDETPCLDEREPRQSDDSGGDEKTASLVRNMSSKKTPDANNEMHVDSMEKVLTFKDQVRNHAASQLGQSMSASASVPVVQGVPVSVAAAAEQQAPAILEARVMDQHGNLVRIDAKNTVGPLSRIAASPAPAVEAAAVAVSSSINFPSEINVGDNNDDDEGNASTTNAQTGLRKRKIFVVAVVVAVAILGAVVIASVISSGSASGGAAETTTATATPPPSTRPSETTTTAATPPPSTRSSVTDVSSVPSVTPSTILSAVPSTPAMTLFEIVQTTPELSTLRLAIRSADASRNIPPFLEETLSGTDELTVFAPSNSGFEELENVVPGYFGMLLTPDFSLHLLHILAYHMTPWIWISTGNFLFLDLPTMLTEETVNVTGAVDTGFEVISFAPVPATILWSDIPASNGVMHLVDNVLVPRFVTQNLVSSLEFFQETQGDNFSTFLRLVVAAGLDTTLAEIEGVALLAPPNDAIPAVTEEFLLTPGNGDILTAVVSYHVINELFNYAAQEIPNILILRSYQGENIVAGLVNSGDSVAVSYNQGVQLGFFPVQQNLVYVIDRILVPPTLSTVVPR